MGVNHPCFVEFAVDDASRFEALCAVFDAIRHDKEAGAFRDEADWLVFFDDNALSHFWWPTAAEYVAYTERWQAASVEQRMSDPALSPPAWDLGSLFMAFENGEYDLLACHPIEGGRARLEFAPLAYPYGGTDCMQALIAAFGFRILAEDDGTGYQVFTGL